MRGDEELLKLLRERWAAVRAGEPQKAALLPAGDWSKLVQLNVRVPASVKKSIEAGAAARNMTLAQFIALTCTKADGEASD